MHEKILQEASVFYKHPELARHTPPSVYAVYRTILAADYSNTNVNMLTRTV